MATAHRTWSEISLINAYRDTFEAIARTPTFFLSKPWTAQGEPTTIIPNNQPDLRPEYRRSWTEPTIANILNLPWGQDDWQEGAQAPKIEAVSHLMVALSATLQPDSPAPHIAPMWNGGVQAEWHQDGVDLQLSVAPDGGITWSYSDMNAGQEHDEESSHHWSQLPHSKMGEYIRKLRQAQV